MSTGRSTLYLSRDEVESIKLPMSRIIEVVEDALIEKAHGRIQMPSKHWMERDATRWFGGMSSLVPKFGYAAMKWQSGSSENYARGLPYITGMLFLNKIDDGLIAAVMDSTWITQQRTAAASAVAIKHLAKKGERSYAMLGTGVQAYSHFEAFRIVMPDLGEVVLYDINPEAAQRFATFVAGQGCRPRIVHSPRAALDATNVFVTSGPIEPNATRSIDAGWWHAGHTAVAIDYDCYFRSAAVNNVDRLLTDDFGQITHIKEYNYFVGCRNPDAELGEVVAGLKPGREQDEQTILVLNMGVAVEDVATAKEIYELARQLKLGTELPQ